MDHSFAQPCIFDLRGSCEFTIHNGIKSPKFYLSSFTDVDAELFAAALPRLVLGMEAGGGAEAMAEMRTALLNYEGIQG